ncbi:hypothetical protein ROSINTL182_06328, partial [Roseburia intestinalis L1-82]
MAVPFLRKVLKYCCLCEENIYIYFFNVLRTAPGLLIISEKKVQTVS